MAKSQGDKNRFPKATNLGRMLPKPSISKPTNTNDKPDNPPKTDDNK